MGAGDGGRGAAGGTAVRRGERRVAGAEAADAGAGSVRGIADETYGAEVREGVPSVGTTERS